MVNVVRTKTGLPEFRPGIDTISASWTYPDPTRFVMLYFSPDSGESLLPLFVQPRQLSQPTVDILAPDMVTMDAKLVVEVFDTQTPSPNTQPLFRDESEKFVITPWPHRSIVAFYPEAQAIRDITPKDLVVVGLGDKRITPEGYLFKIESPTQIDRLFPTNTPMNWYCRAALGQGPFYAMRAGDFNDYDQLLDHVNPDPYGGILTNGALQYMAEAMKTAYIAMSRHPLGVLCAPDIPLDCGPNFGRQHAADLGLFCLTQNQYVQGMIAVVPACSISYTKQLIDQWNKPDLIVTDSSICPIQIPELHGGGWAEWLNDPIPGISLIGTSPGTPGGVGILVFERRYDPATGMSIPQMAWADPTGQMGPWVTVEEGRRYTLYSLEGYTLDVEVVAIPPATTTPLFADVKVTTDLEGHPGARFIYPIYGHCMIGYNDTITGFAQSSEIAIAPYVAARIANLVEEVDPLNTAVGVGAGMPVFYEGFIKLLGLGGINTLRMTIGKGLTMASGLSLSPLAGWNRIKNVRVVNAVVSAIKSLETLRMIGKTGITPKQVEGAAHEAMFGFVGTIVERYTLMAYRVSPYEIRIDLELKIVGTIESIITTVSLGM